MAQEAQGARKVTYNVRQAVKNARIEIADYVAGRLRSDNPGSWAEDIVLAQAGGPVMAAREGVGAEISGTQRLELSYAALTRGERDTRWVTYDEATELGWQVRRGNHASVVEDRKRTEDGYDIYNQNLYNAERCAHSGDARLPEQAIEDARVDKVIDDLLKSMRCHVYMGADRVQYFEMGRHSDSFAVMPDIEEYPSKLAALSDILRIAGEESYNYKMGRDRRSDNDKTRSDLVSYGLACELSAAFIAQSLAVPFVPGAKNARDWKQMADDIEEKESRNALFRAANDAETAAEFELTNVRRHVTQKETAHLDTVRGRGRGLEHVWEYKRYVPRHVAEILDDNGIGRAGMSTPDLDGTLDIERALDAFREGWPMINGITGDIYMATGRINARAYRGGLESAGALLASAQEKSCTDAVRDAIAHGEEINYYSAHTTLSKDGGWELATDESIRRYMDREQAFLDKMAANEQQARDAHQTERTETRPPVEDAREATTDSIGARAAGDALGEAARSDANEPVLEDAAAKERADKIIAAVGESMKKPAPGDTRTRSSAAEPVQTQLPWSVLQPWQKAYEDDTPKTPERADAGAQSPERPMESKRAEEQAASQDAPAPAQAAAPAKPMVEKTGSESPSAGIDAPGAPIEPSGPEDRPTQPAAGADPVEAARPAPEAPGGGDPRQTEEEPVWGGILATPNTAEVASVTDWYQGHEKQLYAIGGTRPGPACWGAQFSVGQGRATVTDREFVSCFRDRRADPRRFLLLTTTRELGGGTLPLSSAIEALAGGGDSGSTQATITQLYRENRSSSVRPTCIKPESYTADQLAMLYTARPDLFSEKDCEAYPELQAVRDAAEERAAATPRHGMENLPWMQRSNAKSHSRGQER